MRHSAVVLAVTALLALVACRQAPPPKQYELTGQILSVKPERSEVVLKHDDIKNFMPAMTMPYKVREKALLTGRKEGDLIKATLSQVGKDFSESPRTPAEIKAYAQAMSDMFCAYITELKAK